MHIRNRHTQKTQPPHAVSKQTPQTINRIVNPRGYRLGTVSGKTFFFCFHLNYLHVQYRSNYRFVISFVSFSKEFCKKGTCLQTLSIHFLEQKRIQSIRDFTNKHRVIQIFRKIAFFVVSHLTLVVVDNAVIRQCRYI